MPKDDKGNKHKGSSLDSFLEEEGTLAEFQAQAIKEVISWQLTERQTDDTGNNHDQEGERMKGPVEQRRSGEFAGRQKEEFAGAGED